MGISFAPPRLEHIGPLTMAGIRRSHPVPRDRRDVCADIDSQWRAFIQIARDMPHLPPALGLGVGLPMHDDAQALDYFCGFVIARPELVVEPLSLLTIPALYCAVFTHHEHASHLRDTIKLIYTTVLPMAGIEAANDGPDTPEFIQRYLDSFDPMTGLGGFEVLVPIKT